jgi:hypothetical protein
MAFIHGSVQRRFHLNDAVIACADHHLAPNATIRTGRARPFQRPSELQDGLVFDSAGWASVSTGTTAHARACQERRCFWCNERAVATIPGAPDELALQFVADAHAAVAGDALRKVRVQIGMSRVLKRLNGWRSEGSCAGCPRNVVVLQPTMEVFLWTEFHRLRGIIQGEQLQQSAAQLFDLRAMCLNLHSISQCCIAGRDRTGRTYHIDDTQTAGSGWLEPVIVAKGWHFNAELMAGGQNGCAFDELVALPVDGHRKHNSNSFP